MDFTRPLFAVFYLSYNIGLHTGLKGNNKHSQLIIADIAHT